MSKKDLSESTILTRLINSYSTYKNDANKIKAGLWVDIFSHYWGYIDGVIADIFYSPYIDVINAIKVKARRLGILN